MLISEALPPCPSSWHPYLGHAQDSFHVAALPPEVRRRRSQIVGGLAIWRRQCTAAGSLRWCSVVPVLIQHTQNTPFCAPTDDIVSYIAESDLMSTFQRVDSHCVPPPILLCGLVLKVLIWTASGKEGGRNTETEVATTAWHKGPQKQRRYYKLLCYGWWGRGWYLVMLCVIIIMEICKAPTLRLKALNKHTHIMYIEMENVIPPKKRERYWQGFKHNYAKDAHTHTHTHTHTHWLYRLIGVKDSVA